MHNTELRDAQDPDCLATAYWELARITMKLESSNPVHGRTSPT